MKDTPFYKQASLLLEMLPTIAKHDAFALKGGTAINFFVRDLPRLSVDIDLTYLPIEDRAETLEAISALLQQTKVDLERSGAVSVFPSTLKNSAHWKGLVVTKPLRRKLVRHLSSIWPAIIAPW